MLSQNCSQKQTTNLHGSYTAICVCERVNEKHCVGTNDIKVGHTSAESLGTILFFSFLTPNISV